MLFIYSTKKTASPIGYGRGPQKRFLTQKASELEKIRLPIRDTNLSRR